MGWGVVGWGGVGLGWGDAVSGVTRRRSTGVSSRDMGWGGTGWGSDCARSERSRAFQMVNVQGLLDARCLNFGMARAHTLARAVSRTPAVCVRRSLAWLTPIITRRCMPCAAWKKPECGITLVVQTVQRTRTDRVPSTRCDHEVSGITRVRTIQYSPFGCDDRLWEYQVWNAQRDQRE